MRTWALLSLAIGSVLLAIAAFFFSQEQSFLQRAVSTTGTITDLAASTSTDSHGFDSTSYCPVIDFRTKDGQTVEYQSSVCSDPPAYTVGQKVDMVYDPQNLKATQMQHSFFDEYLGVIFPGIPGIIFLVIGVGLFMGARSK